MSGNEYIEVAVLLPVHGTFVYRKPSHLKEAAVPGMRVLVPFGRRRVTGYVIAESADDKGFKAKRIFDVLDDIPLFPPQMVPFFKWIADYYIHPLGDVIKTALPVGLNRYDVAMISATEEGAASLESGRLSPGERDVLSQLVTRGPAPLKKLAAKSGNPGIHNLVGKLEKQGLVERTVTLKHDTAKIKKEKYVVFCTYPGGDVRLSKKRKEILALVGASGEVSMRELRKTVPTAPRLVRHLEADGCVRTEERAVFQDPFGDPVDPDVPPPLTREQEAVVDTVIQGMEKGFQRYLLSGVTGSGKTEVYMRTAQAALAKGRSAIVLVPEISLISQTERRFRARFGNRVAVLHSGLSHAELLDQWRRIMKGSVSLVIGARSAIFAPFGNPGLIIVDEEHDTSYKQESGLRYNARDLAVVRAKQHGVPVVLGSATPSVQSYYNACAGKFCELKLTKRINKKPLPEITLVDLKEYRESRGSNKIITPVLSEAIRACLDRGEQALIFLNRRGFATFPVCGACGSSLKCRFCDLTMTYHREMNHYRCHLCGYTAGAKIKCPGCGSSKIVQLGFGTEKVAGMLASLFPDARIARMDQDTTRQKGQLVKLLKMLKNRTVDIVVGTQMLAKGHDFPYITLVGVVCADLSLNFPDFRAGERTFQLLAQVAGRAGRGEKKGKVIMQTYNPDHFTIAASKNQDFEEFFANETPFRKALSYPPYARIIQLKISGTEEAPVRSCALKMGELLTGAIEGDKRFKGAADILGPARAGIPKIATRYRWQILLKGKNPAVLNTLARNVMADRTIKNQAKATVMVDVDPYFMM